MNLKEIRKRIQGKYFSLYSHYIFHVILVHGISNDAVCFIAEGCDTETGDYYDPDRDWNADCGCLDDFVRITKGEFVKRINKIKNTYDAKRSEKIVSR